MSELDNATKQALRLAAVGALLHNLGKINAKFLDKQITSADNDYLYQHILGLIAPHIGKLPAEWQADFDAHKLSSSAVVDGKTINALAHPITLPKPLDDRTDYTIGDLIEYLGVKEKWYKSDSSGKYGIEYFFPGGSLLTHLMNRAHRGASGGEKEDIATAQQPDASALYLSTPFGYETAAPNIWIINDLLQQIEAVIQKYLTSPANPLPLADLIDELRPLLSRAIADTQRPLNDVTVGDIGHTGMAFLLTQAAEWILTGRSIDHDELAQNEAANTLFWRVLTVHTDTLRYLEEAASMADLRVRQRQLQDGFRQVSQRLSETLLAVEVYADEQRRCFVFPNLDQSSPAYQDAVQAIDAGFNIDGLRLAAQLSNPLTNHPGDKNGFYMGDEILNQLRSTPPYLCDAETIRAFWSTQAERVQSQLCTACTVRPQGYGAEQVDDYQSNPDYYQQKATDRNLCCICMARRSGVARQWVIDRLDTTVWLDEVADVSGRLALIVGRWDLVNFGKGVSYPRGKEGADEKQEPDFFRRLEQPTPWARFVNLTGAPLPPQIQIGRSPSVTYRQNNLGWFVGEQGRALPNKFKSPTFPQLNLAVDAVYLENNEYFVRLGSPHGQTGRVQLVGQQFEVANSHTVKTVDVNGRNRVVNLFLHSDQFIVDDCLQVYPTTPNYSFARLRRIWETTRNFWQAVCPTDTDHEMQESLVGQVVGQRPDRLVITGTLAPVETGATPGHYYTYDLKLANNITLSVVWDVDNKRFITCDNLAYLEKPELLGAPVRDFLKGELTLEEPTGYGSQNKRWGKITIESAQALPNSAYTPAIPILAEPRTFMALVPADRALEVLDAIKTKYEREMGKVRNRLPLHLGAVFFQRRTPLRAALDAGRRMLQQQPLGGDQPWTVNATRSLQRSDLPDPLVTGTKHFDATTLLTLTQGGRTITWPVPAVMGDGVTVDNWYPYVFFHSNKDGERNPTACTETRTSVFKARRPTGDSGTEECWLIHASQLKCGDRVYFTPATFDFEWLDSSGRRFEIAYDPQTGHRRSRAGLSPTRPYLLDELATIRQVWELVAGPDGLTSSQLYALRDLVEAKRESWGEGATFHRFCSDAVRNVQWKDAKSIDLPLITNAARSGLLADVVELFLHIMKCTVSRAPEGEGTE